MILFPQKSRRLLLSALGTLLLLPMAAAEATRRPLSLQDYVVVQSPRLTAREKKAVTLLVDEVEKRTKIRWPATGSSAAPAPGSIWVGRGDDAAAEGYRIRTAPDDRRPAIEILGNDERGVLFGVGRLLRELEMGDGRIVLTNPLNLVTAPKYPVRGHQISYRPKSNTYDAWTVPMREQYIRDLAVFGTNVVELIPPDSDDEPFSPHFTLPAMEMMCETARLLDEYGLDVGLWYPLTRGDYSIPAAVAQSLTEWTEVLSRIPRLDALFVPGANGKAVPPRLLLAYAEKIAPILRRFHPRAELWVSPQMFTQAWLDEFFALLRPEPKWLTGVVYGPSIRIGLPEFRKQVPPRLGVRFYPDITHSCAGQFPMADWDPAFGLTHGRESINPRPVDQTHIFRLLQPSAERGFITYSEGCNDDVNKFVWSSLGWDPTAQPIQFLREYGRYFFGGVHADGIAQGLLALERNWRGPLLANSGVDTTLGRWREMEHAATPAMLANWRFQQGLYRAYYDAYVRARLLHETSAESAAMAALRQVNQAGALAALEAAGKILTAARSAPPAPEWRARIFELGGTLFRSIGMQLSVPLHQASHPRRGATLDTIDTPLTNGPWLLARMAELRKIEDESARHAEILGIVNWANPGPGGFYDDFGNPSAQPHLVRGPGFANDPGFIHSSNGEFILESGEPPLRRAWRDSAQTLYDTPLEAHYVDLDPAARYRIRVVYAGEDNHPIRLSANNRLEVHGFRSRGTTVRPVEFDIPAAATRDGTLTLSWHLPPGVTKSAHCQVAEVWLIKQ